MCVQGQDLSLKRDTMTLVTEKTQALAPIQSETAVPLCVLLCSDPCHDKEVSPAQDRQRNYVCKRSSHEAIHSVLMGKL